MNKMDKQKRTFFRMGKVSGSFVYRFYPKHSDRQFCANSADPDKKNAVLFWRRPIQQFLDTSTGSQMEVQIPGQVWDGVVVSEYLGKIR